MKYNRVKLLGFMLTLALVIGLLPVMSLTAYADTEKSEMIATTSQTVDGTHFTISNNNGNANGDGMSANLGITVTPKNTEYITKVVITCQIAPDNVSDGNTTVSSGTKTITNGGGTITVTEVNANTFTFTCSDGGPQFNQFVVYYLESEPTTVAVTGMTLDQTTATLNVGAVQKLTATVEPNNATDKTVKWSVGGTDAGAVKLYSDEACTTEVGTDATETLTVYAKGMSAGSSTVTATSNADSTKTASCAVTVNAAESSTYTVTFTANGNTLSRDVTLPHTFSCDYSNEDGELDQIIKSLYGLSRGYCARSESPTVSGATGVTAGLNGDNQYITISATFDGTATVSGSYNDSSTYDAFTYTLAITCPAPASATSSTYTITIPDTLTVQNIGWNELEGGITASGDLESGAKLVITASSDTNFNFVKSGDNTAQIPYVFTSRDAGNGKSYSDVQSSGVTSWTFDKLTEAGTSHDVGIVIDDYSNMPAGTYKETVTFTAKVENAVTTRTVTWDSSVFGNINLFEVNESYTNSGITVEMTSMESGGFYGNQMMSGGTATFVFSSTAGNIKEIVITAEHVDYFNNVWSIGSNRDTLTWSGTPASSVTLSSEPISIRDISSIVFTIEE